METEIATHKIIRTIRKLDYRSKNVEAIQKASERDIDTGVQCAVYPGVPLSCCSCVSSKRGHSNVLLTYFETEVTDGEGHTSIAHIKRFACCQDGTTINYTCETCNKISFIGNIMCCLTIPCFLGTQCIQSDKFKSIKKCDYVTYNAAVRHHKIKGYGRFEFDNKNIAYYVYKGRQYKVLDIPQYADFRLVKKDTIIIRK